MKSGSRQPGSTSSPSSKVQDPAGGPAASQPRLRRAWGGVILAAALVGASGTAGGAPAQEPEPWRVPGEQLLILREAHNVLDEVGDLVWPGWSSIPRALLFVDYEREFLVDYPANHAPPEEFVVNDQIVGGAPVYSRPRTLSMDLRAAFSIGGIPTAVVGSWQWQVETPNEWVLTLGHQWFHALQLHRGEREKVAGLEIAAANDATWHLNYPFPYEDTDVGNALQLLGQALYDSWSASRRLPLKQQRTYIAETAWVALQNFRAILRLKQHEGAYRYFLFQTWKEGTARYTEVQLARLVAERELLDDFSHVPGYHLLRNGKEYAVHWDENIRNIFWLIRNAGRPGERDRTAFYSLGHGMAELLDTIFPAWKTRYFEPSTWLDDLLALALEKPMLTDVGD